MSATGLDRPPLPTRFPTWPGLLLGALAAALLAGAGFAGLLDGGIGGVLGGPMAFAHGLAIVAIATLIGEALRILGWDRALQACRSSADAKRSGWPVDAVDDACRRLHRRHSTQEQRTEIARTGSMILEKQVWTWQLAWIVAFLVPAIGFAGALWNLRIERNTIPYREVALPLLVSLAEVLPILLLAVGVRGLARSLIEQWKLVAEEVCGLRNPEGGIDPGAAFHQAEYAPVDVVEPRPQQPPPYNAPPPRPAPPRADAGGWPEEFDDAPPRPQPRPQARPEPEREAPRKPAPEAPKKPRSNRPEDYY
ncbi:MAG: hypothetical protein U0800_06875 [Isosphaeraceae bacterium]